MAKGTIVKAAGAISLATSLSRILGYIKDMILAKYFGATGISDVFFVAFVYRIYWENFCWRLYVLSCYSCFKEYQIKEGAEESKKIVKSLFTFIMIVVGGITMLGIIFSPLIVKVIAPGFNWKLSKIWTYSFTYKNNVPFLLFVSFAALTMGTLNTQNIFFVPALAPCF